MSSRGPRSDAGRRDFVHRVRCQNEGEFGPNARPAVEQLLAAGHSHPWTYVYELTQNAIDAGARRVAWRQTDEGAVRFQHDGGQALDRDHVHALASLGQSTKGLSAIGFMGVGFKSVFARFRRARVSGFGWRFRFDISTERGDLGTSVTRWFDTLLPAWDEESPALNPEADYTTAFQLSHPADPNRSLTADLDRLAAQDDPIPLAILALRGLEEVHIDDVTWRLSAEEGRVEVRSSRGSAFRWQSFMARYRPGDDAMRALLEARRKLKEQRDDQGQRPRRKVIALVPLDSDGRPAPPDRGRAYATLPTQTPVPFGFHLQADWLVDLDRRNLRSIEEDAWQRAIVRQVPELVRQVLVWLKKQPDESKEPGYRLLADPTKDGGPLSGALGRLRGEFNKALGDLAVVPIHGARRGGYGSLADVARLPGQLREDFGRQPRWRPDLLFDRELVQERILGKRGTDFLLWLGCARDVERGDVRWPETLPAWWSALAELRDAERAEALFALWRGIDGLEWHDVAAVPTETGTWLAAEHTRFLNEEPPSTKEPSGPAVERALTGLLPQPDRRLPAWLRNRVTQSHHPGAAWLKHRQRNLNLASVVRSACDAVKDESAFPLVELLEWALRRGDRRQDLVPLVMTEDGPRKPDQALIADPLVDHGRCRRALFPQMPALVEDYAIIEDRGAVLLFLERLGVPGQVELQERKTRYHSSQRSQVEREIGAEPPPTGKQSSYTVVDYDFPFLVANVPAEALQDWLSGNPSSLRGFGTKRAEGSYHGTKRAQGTKPCAWIQVLRQQSWLLGNDGERRKPGNVLLAPNPDYEGAAVADIDPELAEALQQEGIEFGENLLKSPALSRLALRGAEEMPDAELATLLREVQEELAAGEATRAKLAAALEGLKLRGAPLVSRTVRRCGPGEGLRSDLGGWVVPLSSVSSELAAVVGELVPSVPKTTTGHQALDFLVHVWDDQPARVEGLRSRIASAYRYVLDDLDAGRLPMSRWEESRKRARLHGQGQWLPVDTSSLIVDDVHSPFIRQSLPDHRIAVAAAHLGETAQSVSRVAERLGIPLLSDQVRVQPGRALAHEPPWTGRLKQIVQTLALLEDRKEIRQLTFHEDLRLHVGGRERALLAYAEDDTFRLVGEPSSFAVEAADQLVNHFQLSQRGHDVAWLTGALFALEDSRSFRTHLRTLANGLGVDVDLDDLGPDDHAKPVAEDHEAGEPDVETDRPEPRPATKRPAANQVAVFVESRGDGKSTLKAASSTSAKTRTAPKSDKKARRAVVKFEKAQGRKAREAPGGQPGFDVLSLDPKTGRELRRIEVKGVQRRFDGKDASVLLSARQVNDALEQEDGAEYWLYVVDSTDTLEPRVIPIPWTRWRGRLRYGFFARAWNQYAERPSNPSNPPVQE